jgi:hypothetical protein
LNGFDYVDVVSALKARPRSPALRKVQEQIKPMWRAAEQFLGNAYWGLIQLPPLNLELVAHYLESIKVSPGHEAARSSAASSPV